MRHGLRVAVLAGAIAAGGLSAFAAPAHAQAPLLTVGVDVESATLTEVRYALFVANRGNAPAAGVVLTNTVPANTTFSASDRVPNPPSGGAACAAGAPPGTTCRWTVGDLPPGSSATVGVTYALDQTGGYDVSNTASAQLGGAAPGGSDQSDTDSSFGRAVHALVDAHVDEAQPAKNFGACQQLKQRRDNSQAVFVDSNSVGDAESTPSRPETVWAAQLEASVESVSPAAVSMPIALHRVTSRWDEGTGNCAGGDGSGRQARAGARPESESSPVTSATVSGPGVVRWNVRDALDTRGERFGFEGFELRAGGAGTPLDTVVFHSREAAVAANQPRLVVVRTNVEPVRCVDSDEETGTAPADRPRRIDAYVTDGLSRIESSGLDGCGGSPVAGAPVGWELDDDAPDAYFSSLAGVATARGAGSAGDVGPNDGSTLADSAGRTFVEIRRADPWGAIGDSENRIAAIALTQDPNGSTDPAPGTSQGATDPGDVCRGANTLPGPCPGTGENTQEDDVRQTWTAPVEPVPPGGGAGGEGGGGGGGGGGSVTTSARSINLVASKSPAAVDDSVMLAGRLTSVSGACAGASEFVQILRRRRGTRELTDFASVTTQPDGSFELPLLVDASAEYVASTPARADCAAASSPMLEVLAQGKVRAAVAGARRLRRGASTRIYGRVLPALRSSVVLERRVKRGWKRVASQKLNRGRAFSFRMAANWGGRRTFRVRWRSPSAAYASAVSRKLTLTTRSRR